MSWQDDQYEAYSTADDLGISRDDLDQWHEVSDWTWADISERLDVQKEFAEYYENDENPPDDLYDRFYEYEDWDDYPEWMSYYHEK